MAPTSPARIEVRTKVLYGIIATERSFLIGYRKLVKREHAFMLAFKAVENRLPPEVTMLIAERLFSLEADQVSRSWNSNVPHRDMVKRFRYDMPRTPAERSVLRQMHDMGINAVAVRASNPREPDGTESRGTSCYAHISAAKRRPAIVANLAFDSFHFSPSSLVAGDTGFWFSSLKHAGLRSTPERQHYDVQRSIDHVAGSWSTYTRGDYSQGKGTSGEVTTLSLCTGIEDVIRDWDAETIEQYVNVLGLDVVSHDPANRLRPGLQVWQFLSDR